MTSNALMNPENAPRSEEELASEGVFVHRARVDALHGFILSCSETMDGGKPSCVRLSSSLPANFLPNFCIGSSNEYGVARMAPSVALRSYGAHSPHCLKRNGTLAEAH